MTTMVVKRWHAWANQPKFNKLWHEQDIADKLNELKAALGLLVGWSEKSDVIYTVTRERRLDLEVLITICMRQLWYWSLLP